MDDALGLHALPAAQRSFLHQYRRETLATQARIEPETGDTAAHDKDVSAE